MKVMSTVTEAESHLDLRASSKLKAPSYNVPSMIFTLASYTIMLAESTVLRCSSATCTIIYYTKNIICHGLFQL